MTLLMSVLSDGQNVVEREGLSARHPCKPLFIATFNPDEGTVRKARGVVVRPSDNAAARQQQEWMMVTAGRLLD